MALFSKSKEETKLSSLNFKPCLAFQESKPFKNLMSPEHRFLIPASLKRHHKDETLRHKEKAS
jgi:hypothetical protein